MSKFIFIKYRKESDAQQLDLLQKVCDRLTPLEIKSHVKHNIFKSSFCQNSFIAVQNDDITQDKNYLEIGQSTSERENIHKQERHTFDGSYALIRFDHQHIEFFCDQFGSRTLWCFLDDQKLILSTSQRAITMLKGRFDLEKVTSAWFLSSGTQGYATSWDSQIEKILPDIFYRFDCENWKLFKEDRLTDVINTPNFGKQNIKEYFISQISNNILSTVEKYDPKELILPISGGNDSRLLLSLTEKKPILSNIHLINWGITSDGSVFNDKVASRKIASSYKRKYLDIQIPTQVDNKEKFLEDFICQSEGRIDHFNAYTDSFRLWENLTKSGYKAVMRGDIPFTEGVDFNAITARSHIGINLFTDFANYSEYNFSEFIELQQVPEDFVKKKAESYIEWRDRLYITYRIPIVISTFTDIISSYVENRSPIMSFNLFKKYSLLPKRDKGNKKIIVDLSKRLDKSGVSFAATPSIPIQSQVFQNSSGIKFLKTYIRNTTATPLLNAVLRSDVVQKLENIELHRATETKFTSLIKVRLSEKLPMYLKGFIKSKRKIYLDPVTIAYRIVMIDMIVKLYEQDANFLKMIK